MVIDKNRRQICPGDLLRSFHFTGARRKKYYLYHVAVLNRDYQRETLEAVPVCSLEPTKRNQGGKCWLTQDVATNMEIIYGSGPGKLLGFDDRPKQPIEAGAA